jgi:parallel beta-helix repeat protein
MPGQGIQAALDLLKDNGGCVVLAKGTHLIENGLRIPSKVTLAGQGAGSILKLAEGKAGTLISADGDSLHDVVIRDLVVDGGASAGEMNDAKARNIAGIILVSMKPPDMKNIRLEHVTVRGCTNMGVHIKGADAVTVADCDISGNGGLVGKGAAFMHNLYVRRVSAAVIENNRLCHSPHGNGLNISYSSDLKVIHNVSSGNGFRGIRAAETKGLDITGNTADDNRTSGIVVNSEGNGCDGFQVKGNTARHNKASGVEIRAGANGTVTGNTCQANGGEPISDTHSQNVTIADNTVK